MKTILSKKHLIMLVCSYTLILAGLVLCLNYFFVPGVGTANIVANIALTLAFLATAWYMMMGYKKNSDFAFGIPLFAYAICIIVMNATATVSIATATPFITASMGTLIVYPIVIAFNQNRVKLCAILFAIMIVAELGHGFFTFFLYGPDGVMDGGSITATLNNIHIFVRGFMSSALAVSYSAKVVRSKKDSNN